MLSLRRPTAIVLVVALMPQLGGCVIHSTSEVAPAQLSAGEMGLPGEGEPRVVGVTTDGEQVFMFDADPAPRVTPDGIFAVAEGTRLSIPTASIRKVWLARPGERAAPVRRVGSVEATRADSTALGARIRGVTTTAGGRVAFDRTAPVRIARDTLRAFVDGSPYVLPVAQAKGLWVRRPNAGLTALLWIGSTVGVLAAIVGIGMSNYHPNFFAGGS